MGIEQRRRAETHTVADDIGVQAQPQNVAVRQGDLIGYGGNTGRSTGPHRHYEVLRDGEPVDPSGYYELD